MVTMLSNKPYVLRAFYQWIVDSRCSPYLLVQADFPDVVVPVQYIDEEHRITLNASPKAVQDFAITDEAVTFTASFNGVVHSIFLPLPAVLTIYAAENGEGMVFEEEDPKDYLTARKQVEVSEKKSPHLKTQVPYLRVLDDNGHEDE